MFNIYKILAVLLFIVSITINAQVPHTINYQGILTDANGVIIPNGNYEITAKIYNIDLGGSPLWSETQTIYVEEGVYSTILGSINPINLPFDQQYWVAVLINAGPELTPRIKLSTVPYSFNSKSVIDNSITSSKIVDGTITGSDIGNNQVIKKINGITDSLNLVAGSNVTLTPNNNSIIISSASGPGGTITGITAGNGLTGGGTSGNVIIAVNDAGITNGMLQNNSVTSDKIVDNTITATDIGSNQVVKSINSLKDSVTIEGGGTVSVYKYENIISIVSVPGWGQRNRIPKFYDYGSYLGESNIVSTEEGNIGINTYTPQGILDVQGGTAVDGDTARGINLIAQNTEYGSGISGGSFVIKSGRGGLGDGASMILSGGNHYGHGGNVNISSGSGQFGGDITITSATGNNSGGNILLRTNGGYFLPPSLLMDCGRAFEQGGGVNITAGKQGDLFGLIELHSGGAYVKLNGDGVNDTVKIGQSLASISVSNNIVSTLAGGGLFQINGSGTYTGTWTQSSDERYKKNIQPLNNSLQKIQQLNGVSYEFRSEDYPEKNFDNGEQIGLIAQDVEKVLPELVKTDSEGYKSVAYQNVVAVLIEAIKELKKEVTELKNKINEDSAILINTNSK